MEGFIVGCILAFIVSMGIAKLVSMVAMVKRRKI